MTLLVHLLAHFIGTTLVACALHLGVHWGWAPSCCKERSNDILKMACGGTIRIDALWCEQSQVDREARLCAFGIPPATGRTRASTRANSGMTQ